MKKILVVGISIIVLLSTGCAGTDFIKPGKEKLVLGKTTKSELRLTLGEPYQTGEKLFNGENVETNSYSFANAGGEAVFEEVTPARTLGLLYVKDILVGYEFTSTFKSDSTYYDSEKVKEIKKGWSKSQIRELLGEPKGKFIYPIIDDKNGDAYNYLYVQAKGFQFYVQNLRVTFDENGIVTDIKYESSGTK
ncbi:outer membrane protein assembly factor BamE [Kaarinaea lacus]